MDKEIVVLIGAGSIGLAIVRRIGAGKSILIADISPDNAKAAVETLAQAGFEATATTVDLSSRSAVQELAQLALSKGAITRFIVAAGVSPSQAPIDAILKIDLYGTAMALEVFGEVMAEGGTGLVISSQSGYRLKALTDEENELLATTPSEELLSLEILQPGNIKDTLHAYQLSKRCNVLRVAAESVTWGARGARLNSISPGIIITPLAYDELQGPRGEMYAEMINSCPAQRAGTPDEVATIAALLMGEDGSFITGSDILMDGGVTASYWYGGN